VGKLALRFSEQADDPISWILLVDLASPRGRRRSEANTSAVRFDRWCPGLGSKHTVLPTPDAEADPHKSQPSSKEKKAWVGARDWTRTSTG